MQISHETIYTSLFVQARGVLKKERVAHLRTHRMMRKSKLASKVGQPRGQIRDAISIRDRPAAIEDRAIPGHWEGALITGSHHSHIAMLVERTSRFTMLVKVRGKDTVSVVSALQRQIGTPPAALRRSLTWDRGMELARYQHFTLATKMAVYFCDPQSPWQRGTNENTNGLLRQYFPSGTDLRSFSQSALDRTALELNQRPRKTLGFRTLAESLVCSCCIDRLNRPLLKSRADSQSPLLAIPRVERSDWSSDRFCPVRANGDNRDEVYTRAQRASRNASAELVVDWPPFWRDSGRCDSGLHGYHHSCGECHDTRARHCHDRILDFEKR